MVREGAQPAELAPRLNSAAAEDGEHAQRSRRGRSAAARRSTRSPRASAQSGSASQVSLLGDPQQLAASPRRTDLPDLAHAERESGGSTRPSATQNSLGIDAGRTGARDQVQTARLVGTLATHHAVVANVARCHQPDAGQSDPGLRRLRSPTMCAQDLRSARGPGPRSAPPCCRASGFTGPRVMRSQVYPYGYLMNFHDSPELLKHPCRSTQDPLTTHEQCLV